MTIEQIIENNCQPFIKQINDYQNICLYRGLQHKHVEMRDGIGYIKGHVEDRKPKKVPLFLHLAFNGVFSKYYKTPFRNGVFCTGNKDTANKYVTNSEAGLYKIIPVGDFKYCWSNTVDDVFEYYVSHKSENILDHEMEWGEIIEFIDGEVVDKYKITDLHDAISSNNEVMIYCDECIVIPVASNN